MKYSVSDYKNYTGRNRCCGICKHWHERDEYKGGGVLAIGDCDKIPEGHQLTPSADGTIYTYDGYSFEDEVYDEEWGCFEPMPETGDAT